MLKIPQPRMLSWLFEGGDREEQDGIDRHGPIVRRVYVVANALTVVMMTLFIPYEALVEVSPTMPCLGFLVITSALKSETRSLNMRYC